MKATKLIPSMTGGGVLVELAGQAMGIGTGAGLAAVAGVGSAGVTAGMYTEGTAMTTKDHIVAAIPAVASAVVAGLTLGWPQAIVGFLLGPLSNMLVSIVDSK